MARVMVVEDEPITAADLEQKLLALGHDVTWLDTGEEAVARAQQLEHDLVLMDVRLRGAMSGIEAARELRSQSDVPIVFLTAFADPETVNRACETQPHGYLLKPFSDRGVASAVQVALARASAERRELARERTASRTRSGALSMKLAHEINNPLTCNLIALQLAIGALAELHALAAHEDSPDPARAQRESQLVAIRDLLGDARVGAERVASVVRELTSFSLGDLEHARFATLELAALGVGLSGVETADRVRLVWQVRPAPLVEGNRWQLGGLLAYGLRSAREAQLRRGLAPITLAIHVGEDARGWAEIRIITSGEPPRAGVALPVEDAAQVTSVSAAAAQQIAAIHGADWIACDDDNGIGFELHLPPARIDRVARGAAMPENVARRRQRMLVIDDEPTIGKVLEIMLRSEYDVTSVSSGQSGLDLLERSDFDLVLCDLSMPEMSGRDFHDRLRKTQPELARRVAFMSGGPTNLTDAEFLEHEAARCIAKPFSKHDLLGFVSARLASIPDRTGG